jgi:hypothetical protein
MNVTELENIVRDIENGRLTVNQIIEKYHITKYKYNKIRVEYDLQKDYVSLNDGENKKKPKNTKFKKILFQMDVPEPNSSDFDMDAFKKDCVTGMKLSALMDKHHLSLYQIRELRKKYDLKTK